MYFLSVCFKAVKSPQSVSKQTVPWIVSATGELCVRELGNNKAHLIPSALCHSGTSLPIFPKDTCWCFHVLCLLPHIVSSDSSLSHFPVISHTAPTLAWAEIRGKPVYFDSKSEASLISIAWGVELSFAFLSPPSFSIGCSAYLLVMCARPALFFFRPCLRRSCLGSREGAF